jgi:hypothetical protein
MKTHSRTRTTAFVASVAVLLSIVPLRVSAHCDGLDGPVVQAAQKALATSNASLALIWVRKDDEAEVRKAFQKTLAVRNLNAEAKELADTYFFETLVRIHRAGEGAPYTGLKPAARDLGPAIPAADKTLKDGKVEALTKLLTKTVQDGVQRHFNEALKKKNFPANDIESGREFVRAYVEYIHCVEALYEQATRETHGHFHESNDSRHPHEK